MTPHKLREWDYLDVNDSGADRSITRAAVDSLIGVARGCPFGGDDGQSVLVDLHKRIRAQQVVGVLASRSATLELLPKIENLEDDLVRRNLVHMLARVYDLDIASGAPTDLGWQSHDLLEILIRLFCERLFAMVHRGLPRRYVEHADDLPALRGRLDAVRQFTVRAARPEKLACRYEDLSPDIPLNQIMKAAVGRLSAISKASENQRRLRELALAFADVSDIEASRLPWDRVVLDRTNIAWKSLLALAKLLLGERFQTTTLGGAQGFSLLFEMNTLFEEFIGRTLKRELAGSGLAIRLQGPIKYALTDERGAQRFRTRPDIVISRAGRPLLIIDTKWKRLTGVIDDAKRGVGQADVYQMMAYAQVYKCDRVMLLYPHHGETGQGAGRLDRHRISGTDDALVTIASVGLTDIGAVGAALRVLVSPDLAIERDVTRAAA